ncbi:MAG: hypothetical protein QW731_06810, partial [Thermofilaceae archaeon]
MSCRVFKPYETWSILALSLALVHYRHDKQGPTPCTLHSVPSLLDFTLSRASWNVRCFSRSVIRIATL